MSCHNSGVNTKIMFLYSMQHTKFMLAMFFFLGCVLICVRLLEKYACLYLFQKISSLKNNFCTFEIKTIIFAIPFFPDDSDNWIISILQFWSMQIIEEFVIGVWRLHYLIFKNWRYVWVFNDFLSFEKYFRLIFNNAIALKCFQKIATIKLLNI